VHLDLAEEFPEPDLVIGGDRSTSRNTTTLWSRNAL